MKKFINALLVFVLVFTLAVPAMAASEPLADVKGTEYEAAVTELAALEILNGYPDGTFKPNNTITRAEFAKVVVLATGNSTMVKYLDNSQTQFSDVKVGDWYNGYVNAAAAKGFLKGYPDGTFKPNAQITYQEAVTVLVRALGYKDENLAGSWPYNMLIQADEIGLMDGVDVNATAPAGRGDVAILTSNTLDASLVTWNADDEEYVEGKKLITKLGNSVTKVVKETELTDDDELVFVDGDDTDSADDVIAVADNFVISGGKTLAQLHGHEVTVITNSSGEVVVVTDAQDEDYVVVDAVDTVDDANTITLDNEDSYDLATDAVLFYNDNEVADFNAAGFAGADVTLFLDEDEDVRFVIATEFNHVNLVVTDLSDVSSTGRATITTLGTTTSVKITEDTVFYLDGKEATYAALDENNILNVILDGSNAAKVYAYSKSVEGSVDSVSYAKETVKVKGVTYDLVGQALTDINTLNADDETVYEFFLNGKGEVAYFEVVEGSAAEFVGFLAEFDNYRPVVDGRAQAEVRDLIILGEDGKVVTVRAASATEFNGELGSVFEFVSNDDGEYELADATELTFADGNGVVTDVATSYIEIGTAKHYFDSPVVFDASSYTTTDADVEDVEVIALASINDNDTVKVDKGGDYYVDYIVVTDSANSADDQLDLLVGVVVDKDQVKTSDGTAYYVTLNVDDEEVTHEVYSGAYSAVTKYELTALEDGNVNDDYGQYDAVSSDLHAGVTITTINSTSKTIVVGGVTYVVDSNTVYYLVDTVDGTVDFGTFADISDTTQYTSVDLVAGSELATNVYVLKAITLYGDYTN